jgi:hypothetical protein
MLRAQSAVLDQPNWTDYSQGYDTRTGGLWGWCGFELPGPVPVRRWEARRKPFDLEHGLGTAAQTATAADRSAEAYARAVKILAVAAEDPRLASAPRRSQANLRLCRFWFEMSLFHFQALAVASRDPVRFGATDARATDHGLATWNAVRLSDCLPSYDGRILAEWDEARYGPKWTRDPLHDPFQGNFLAIDTGDPNYRAQRDTDRVLVNLDARLRPQALATIAAARAVMDREARSPWGWVVYYSVLQTYAWEGPDESPASGTSTSTRERQGPRSASSGGGATTPK